MKSNMEQQNMLFNIVNIFAWLPLLLTNLKRVCLGQPLRLFHYVGAKYSQTLSSRMMDAVVIDSSNSEQSLDQIEKTRTIEAAKRIQSALQNRTEPDMHDITQLDAAIRSSYIEFTNTPDLSKLSDNPNEQTYLYDIYRLQNAHLLIKQKIELNCINYYLCMPQPFTDPALIEIADNLKNAKNSLVQGILKQGKQNIVTLIVSDHSIRSRLSANTAKQTQDNPHACSIITQLVMDTRPIYLQDFDTLQDATKGLDYVIKLMNAKGWLRRYTATLVFETYQHWDEELRDQLDTANLNENDSTLQNTVESKLRTICSAKGKPFPETPSSNIGVESAVYPIAH